MKATAVLLSFLAFSLFFSSCSNDAPVNSNPSNSLSGDWTVDKVQIVSAPETGTASAMMKSALVPFGEVDAGFAGYLDFTFAPEVLSTINTDFSIPYSTDFAFYGSYGYANDVVHDMVASTYNGGISWNNYPLPQSDGPNLMPLAPASSTTIYYISHNSGLNLYALYKSTNRGLSWNVVNPQLPFSIYGYFDFNTTLVFTDENTGYALGQDPVYYDNLYKTTNGGVNWERVYNNTNGFFRMYFIDAQTGFSTKYSFGGQSFVKTTDGGVTWSSYPFPAGIGGIGEFNFINSSTGWMNTDIGFFKTVNGGQTWLKQSAIVINYFTAKNENECFAVSSGVMLKSLNGGADWTPYAAETYAGASRIRMVNNEPVFFAGQNTMLKPSGAVDAAKWTAKGKITNPVLKLITGAEDKESFANGSFLLQGINQAGYNEIYFSPNRYSETPTASGMAGAGTYYFDSGFLYVTLNLPANEVWKIKLRRK